MVSLNELAAEYLVNAEKLKGQIAELQGCTHKTTDTNQLFELEHKIKVLEDMHSEQLTTYYRLINYYKKE